MDIDQISARLAAATPAPWRNGSTDMRGGIVQAVTPQGQYQNIATGLRPADAALMANAPQDLTDLIAEVQRLESAVGRCVCAPNHDTTDGADEACPQHGRPYGEWVAQGRLLQQRIGRVREALRTGIEDQQRTGDHFQAYLNQRLAEPGVLNGYLAAMSLQELIDYVLRLRQVTAHAQMALANALSELEPAPQRPDTGPVDSGAIEPGTERVVYASEL